MKVSGGRCWVAKRPCWVAAGWVGLVMGLMRMREFRERD